MRVLLPLRKPATDKQSSNKDLEDSEEVEGVELNDPILTSVDEQGVILTSDGVQVHITPEELPENFSQHHTAEKQCKECQEISLAPQTLLQQGQATVAQGAWNTTALHEPDRKRSTASPRKRPRPSSDDTHQRPALEKKPAAKPPNNMGLSSQGGRKAARGPFLWNEGTSSNSLGRSMVTKNEAIEADDPAMDSGPECESSPGTFSSSIEPDSIFSLELKKRGLEVKEQDGDGNCMFRAVALQVYGDSTMHGQVRQQCMDFMERDKEHFSQFVTGEEFATYILRKRQDGVYGNNPEIQAISELFNRPIEVFSPDSGGTPLNIFHAEYKTDDQPIRLSYHDRNHYNAVVDPLVPTAGLGLGLPGLQPGLADKMQVAKAVAESDATADQMELQRALKESQDDELQRAIKESKLSTEHMRSNEAMALSDVDATYFELEQAALEHSMQSHFHSEHGKKQSASTGREKKGDDSDSNSIPSSLPDSATASRSNVASLPSSSTNVASEARIPEAAVAVAASVSSGPSVASVASAASPAKGQGEDGQSSNRPVEEYPQIIQEMVMNGFELSKVVRAFELIGDNFDDLLAFLMSTAS